MIAASELQILVCGYSVTVGYLLLWEAELTDIIASSTSESEKASKAEKQDGCSTDHLPC